MTQSNVASAPDGSVNAGFWSVSFCDPEVLDAVQHEVHARDGRRGQVLRFAEDAPEEGAWIGAGPLHARSMARIARASAVPTLAGVSRTSRQ